MPALEPNTKSDSISAILSCAIAACAHYDYADCMRMIEREVTLLLRERRLLRGTVDAVAAVAGDQSLDVCVYDIEPLALIRGHLRSAGYEMGVEPSVHRRSR